LLKIVLPLLGRGGYWLLSEEKGLKFSADRMLLMEAAETPAESLYGKEKKLLLD